MTKIFNYDTLTWPEIDSLPRDTPLIIPLGEGYSQERLVSALSNPSQIGFLPTFPFGWEGSGLKLPDSLLSKYLLNLIDSLREDGFSRIFALTPQGLELDLGNNRITLPCYKNDTFQLPSDSDREKVVVIPIGHTEQHGFHLPMSTDTLIIEAIAKGVIESVPHLVTGLPVMPYGVSTHRAAFAGTLNAGGRAFEDFWVAVIDVLASRGFTRFYLMSGHGGNCSFLSNVIKYVGEKHRRIFCVTTWLYLSGKDGVASLEKYRRSKRGGMGHACELETSFILYLRPELVHMERVVDETDFIETPNYYMDWVEGGALIANPPWDDDTKTGAYGAGSLGDAYHGQIWLEAAIAEKIAHIDEINQQHMRREERRNAGFGLWGKTSQ